MPAVDFDAAMPLRRRRAPRRASCRARAWHAFPWVPDYRALAKHCEDARLADQTRLAALRWQRPAPRHCRMGFTRH
jgi:hypothetical protein